MGEEASQIYPKGLLWGMPPTPNQESSLRSGLGNVHKVRSARTGGATVSGITSRRLIKVNSNRYGVASVIRCLQSLAFVQEIQGRDGISLSRPPRPWMLVNSDRHELSLFGGAKFGGVVRNPTPHFSSYPGKSSPIWEW